MVRREPGEARFEQVGIARRRREGDEVARSIEAARREDAEAVRRGNRAEAVRSELAEALRR